MPLQDLSAMLDAAPDVGDPSTSQPSSSRINGLHFMPPEILDLIALYTVIPARSSHLDPSVTFTSPLTPNEQAVPLPPHGLFTLLLTCKRLHKYLDSRSNPNLYARIFAARFDVHPIARRYGTESLQPRPLSRELKRRCRILKRMRRACQLDRLRPEGNTQEGYQNMRECLWLAYLMLTENDGLNIMALRWANVRQYIALYHSQEMLESALQPGYPPDSEDRALALHISYLTTHPGEMAVEDKDDALERLFLLRPFVFASHKFECFYGPWTLRELPISDPSKAREEHLRGLNPAETQSFLAVHRPNNATNSHHGDDQPDTPAAEVNPSEDTSRIRRNPFLADLTPRSKATYVEHCGRRLRMCAPLASHAAYFTFFMQVEQQPNAGGLVAITGRGVEPGTTDRRAGVPPRPPVQLGLLAPELGAGPHGAQVDPLPLEARGPLALRSNDHDADLVRLFACYDPFSGPGLRPTFYANTFNGAWEGRFSFFDFDSYREMLGGQMRSLYTGPFGEQPQVWKLKEHFVKVGASGQPKRGGTASVITAGYEPEAPLEDLTRLPTTLTEAKERARERGGGKREAADASQPHRGLNKGHKGRNGDDDAEHVPSDNDGDEDGDDDDEFDDDLDLYPQFSDEDGGPSASRGYLPPALSGIAGRPSRRRRRDSDVGDADDDDADADDDSQYEMLISGVGHSAWGRFALRGRVRAWDGMVILSKEYRPDGRGRWLYRGYVINGNKLLGRWRDTFTPGDMSGYEGPFLLSKRSEEDEEDLGGEDQPQPQQS